MEKDVRHYHIRRAFPRERHSDTLLPPQKSSKVVKLIFLVPRDAQYSTTYAEQKF